MLLPVLHLFNDGFLAAMPLILPFAADDIGISLGMVGLLGSILGFSGIVLALPAGAAASRFGTARLLSAAVLCYGIGFITLGFSRGTVSVFLSFVLSSIAFGVFHPVAFSAVARAADGKSLGKDMGVFAATGDIGRIVLASAVASVITWTSWRIASGIFGILAVLLFLVCFLLSFRQKGQAEECNGSGGRRALDHRILWKRRFMLANAASVIDAFASSSLFIFIPFLLAFRGIEASFIGFFTALFFVGNLLGKIVLGRLSDHMGKEWLFICCEVGIFISLVLLAFIQERLAIAVLALVLGFLTKGTVPITSTMIAESVGREEFDAAYSISSLSTSVANTAAPLFFGMLADVLGIQSIFIACGLSALCSVLPASAIIRHGRI